MGINGPANGALAYDHQIFSENILKGTFWRVLAGIVLLYLCFGYGCIMCDQIDTTH